jgi:acetolactate synthase-1/3 small subunit
MTDTLPADSAGSAYFLDAETGAERRATFAVIVANEPGVLHRVVGLFSARGYNIESLTVAETDHAVHTSRITIVTRGREVVQVRQVLEVGGDPRWVERELALVKVKGSGEARIEALRLAEIFRAHVIDTGSDSFVFELTGAPDKIDKFETLMRPLGLVEVSRTGVLSIARGAERV